MTPWAEERDLGEPQSETTEGGAAESDPQKPEDPQ